ncbi:MAG: transposase [Phycisphaerae bacterium]
MARPLRHAPGGLAYHVINRGTGRRRVFDDAGDYEAFERVLAEARERVGMRVCAYVVMPNHWHFVLWPRNDGDLSRFMSWLTMTHTQRWHAHRHTTGTGHVYQGRFKSFPIEADDHFLTVCRYVERNPLRAGLVDSVANWRWGSFAVRRASGKRARALLDDWPVKRPRDWARCVNEAETTEQLETLRQCVRRGRPYGREGWTEPTAARLGLQSSLRPQGRPKTPKQPEPEKGS